MMNVCEVSLCLTKGDVSRWGRSRIIKACDTCSFVNRIFFCVNEENYCMLLAVILQLKISDDNICNKTGLISTFDFIYV